MIVVVNETLSVSKAPQNKTKTTKLSELTLSEHHPKSIPFHLENEGKNGKTPTTSSMGGVWLKSGGTDFIHPARRGYF